VPFFGFVITDPDEIAIGVRYREGVSPLLE